MAVELRVRRGEVLSGLAVGKTLRITVQSGPLAPYEAVFREKAPEAWKKHQKTARVCLGRVDEGVAPAAPDQHAWKSKSPWKVALVGLERKEKDGRVDRSEYADGLQFDHIPARAKITIFDALKDEKLVIERDYEDALELVWDGSVTRIRIEAATPKKTWVGVAELPKADRIRDAVILLILRK